MIELFLKANNLKYEKEFRFHPTRKWRFDYAIPEKMIAIEYEGGTWSKGAHVRGKHYSSDCEKYGVASILGWVIIRITADMLQTGLAFKLIEFSLTKKDYNQKEKK